MFLWTGPLFKLGIVLEPSEHSISCLASQWEASIFPTKFRPMRVLKFSHLKLANEMLPCGKSTDMFPA